MRLICRTSCNSSVESSNRAKLIVMPMMGMGQENAEDYELAVGI
jgi:hypothetical protein